VPKDLADALKAKPKAQAMFAILTAQNRYAVLYRIHGAKRPETRARASRSSWTCLRGRNGLRPRRTLSGS